MKRTYEFKTILRDGDVFTVVKFYRSTTLGECHVGYLKIAASSEADAIRVAKEAM